MKPFLAICAIAINFFTAPALGETRTLCTLAIDAASGKALADIGPACDIRVTPASTFKLAISLMAFDTGVLKDQGQPELPFRQGYAAWRPEWKQATTPATWMRDSVVWYSQRVMERLGREQVEAYLENFGYGNRVISGVKGEGDGLTTAWLSNSLQISPREEAAFVGKIVRRELGVSDHAYAMTAAIASYGAMGDGWDVHGKTGAGLPRGKDGMIIRGHAYGWFVGWARKGNRTVVFVRLIQDSEKRPTPPGFRARDTLFAELFAKGGALE